jgi:tetratricopeptide (TPR) repeat protein
MISAHNGAAHRNENVTTCLALLGLGGLRGLKSFQESQFLPIARRLTECGLGRFWPKRMKKVFIMGLGMAGLSLVLEVIVLIIAWRPMVGLTSRRLTIEGATFASRDENTVALRLFNEALTLNPGNAEAHARRAYVEIRIGDASSALVDGQQAVALDDRYALGWAAQGLADEYLDGLKKARADYDHAISLDGRVASYYWHRGWVETHLDDLTGARADLDRAIQMKPGEWTPYDDRAQLDFKMDDLITCESDLARASALAPKMAAPYAHRAYLRIMQGRLDEAIADANKAFQLRPAYGYALYLRASAERRAGKPKIAVETLNTIPLVDPKFKGVVLERAMAYYDAGDGDSARRDFEAAAQAPDARGHALIWLWLLDTEDGRRPDADAELKFLAAAATPDDPWPVRFAGMLQGHLTPEQLQGETGSLKTPMLRMDFICQAWFLAGKLAEGNGDRTLARADLQKAVESGAANIAEYSEAQRELARP